MTFQCIGKRESGKRCTNTSPTPSLLHRPEAGYLCSECANEPPRRGSRNTRGIVEERPMDPDQVVTSVLAIKKSLDNAAAVVVA